MTENIILEMLDYLSGMLERADKMKIREALEKITSKCDKQDLTSEQVIDIISEVLKDE